MPQLFPHSSTITQQAPNLTSTNWNPLATLSMADRNILPDHFKASHYDLVLTNLDFQKWTYSGSVTYVPALEMSS